MAPASRRWWQSLLPLLLVALTLLCLPGAEAQWGVPGKKQKQKHDNSVRLEREAEGGLTFGDLQRRAAKADSKGPADWDDLMHGLDWDKVLSEAMESPEVQQLLNDPAALQEALKDNPLLKNIPGMEKVLDSPELKDPEKVKKILKKGMDQFKDGITDWVEAMSDPDKLEQALSQYTKDLSPEEQEKTRKLLKGDPDAIEEAVEELGKAFEEFGKQFKDQMKDPDFIEKTRGIFNERGLADSFEDPDLKDMASDPDKWKKVMEDNLKLLYNKGEEL